MKNPLTLEQLKTNDIFGCNPIQPDPAACPNPQTCNYSDSAPGGSKQMKSCTGCPPAYPWLDNPSGLPQFLDNDNNNLPADNPFVQCIKLCAKAANLKYFKMKAINVHFSCDNKVEEITPFYEHELC